MLKLIGGRPTVMRPFFVSKTICPECSRSVRTGRFSMDRNSTPGIFVWRCKMKSYKLGDRFEIVEDDKGKWKWRGWIGFDNIEGGKCFVEGNILFISKAGTTFERGVAGEDFEGHLKSLPQWTKTKYYCSRYTLHICETGRISSR
jgi:hypothetical protein